MNSAKSRALPLVQGALISHRHKGARRAANSTAFPRNPDMATIGMVDGASTLGAGSQLPRPVSGTTHPQGVPAHGAEEHHEPLRMGHARRQEAQRPKRVVAVPLMCQEHQGPGSSVGPSMRQMAEMPAALSDYSPTRLFASVRTPHQPCIPLSSTQHAGEPGRRAQRAAAQSAQSRRLGRLAGNGRQGQDELLVVRAQRPGWSRGGRLREALCLCANARARGHVRAVSEVYPLPTQGPSKGRYQRFREHVKEVRVRWA